MKLGMILERRYMVTFSVVGRENTFGSFVKGPLTSWKAGQEWACVPPRRVHRRASFHSSTVSSHQRDSCSHRIQVITLHWQHSLVMLYIFKKPSIPLYLHLKVPHALADPCVDNVFPGILLSGVGAFSRGSARWCSFFCPLQGWVDIFCPIQKTSSYGEKPYFLWKLNVVPKSFLRKKKVTYDVYLDHVNGISPKGSNLHIQKRTCV